MNVIAFRRSARTSTFGATRHDGKASHKTAIARTVYDLYFYAPEELRQCAAVCAHDCIDQGGSFMDAMDAAERIIKASGIQPYAPSTEAERVAAEQARNAVRIGKYLESRATLHADRLTIASEIIRERLRGHQQHDIEAAIKRASRVIEGNGLVATALYFALQMGDE